MEFREHFGALGVDFESLLVAACDAGRSTALSTLRKHPVSVLMRRFRDQVLVCCYRIHLVR
jgi:hypothetical protein